MLMDELKELKETCWTNPNLKAFEIAAKSCELSIHDVEDAAARWDRFSDYFKVAFPETKATNGIIESPFQEIPLMKSAIEDLFNVSVEGKLYIKLDSHLAISGSIKARGGVYEVLKFAEDIALQSGMLQLSDNYGVLADEKFRKIFSRYSIAVGSTGNLGLSIGIISAKLGFNVSVHMSADARQWKKDMLRSKGVNVVEYLSDYSEAVRQGRLAAEKDPYCHFVDDENSKTLFLGYSVAALRLKKQLQENHVVVDESHPLFVYLPCGVGGGPGGVAFGLKQVFGDKVHCFFAEPTNACCMILGMSTGLHNEISVQDIGICGKTDADGLAVGRASGFVGKLMEPFISGCYTISDERMYQFLSLLADTENIYLEPSALAGMYGPVLVHKDSGFKTFKADKNATHIVWATGGSMVPAEIMKQYYDKGRKS